MRPEIGDRIRLAGRTTWWRIAEIYRTPVGDGMEWCARCVSPAGWRAIQEGREPPTVPVLVADLALELETGTSSPNRWRQRLTQVELQLGADS